MSLMSHASTEAKAPEKLALEVKNLNFFYG